MQRLQRREFWMVVLLTIVTCGIYSYIFIYKTTEDFNQMAGDDGETIEPGSAVLFTLLTCGIYIFWWYYKMGNRIQNLAKKNNLYVNEDGESYLLWMLVGNLLCGIGGLVAQYLCLKNHNLLVDAYNAHLDSSVGSYPPPSPPSGGGGAFSAYPPAAPPQPTVIPPISPVTPPTPPVTQQTPPAATPPVLPMPSNDAFAPPAPPPEPAVTPASPEGTSSEGSVSDSLAELLASVETSTTPPTESDLTQPSAPSSDIPAPPDLPTMD